MPFVAAVYALLAIVDFDGSNNDAARKAVEIQAKLGLHFLLLFLAVPRRAGVDVYDPSNFSGVIAVLDRFVTEHDQLCPRLANTQRS